MNRAAQLLLLVPLALAAAGRAQVSGAKPSARPAPRALRCEWLVEPRGHDVASPRFSWEPDPADDGAQGAWQVVVSKDRARAAAGEGEAWDSGLVRSAESANVAYAGAPLESGTRYFWAVRTHDAAERPSAWSEPASWTTGFFERERWSARWVEDAGSREASAAAHEGYHSPFFAAEDGYVWLQVDLGAPTIFDGFRLHPGRPGAAGQTTLFPKRFKVWVGDDATFLQAFQKVVDRSVDDVAEPGAQPLELSLAPSRYKVRYVRIGVSKLPRAGDRGFAFALAELEVTNGGAPISRGARVAASASLEEGAWSLSRLCDGDLASHGPRLAPAAPAPLLRKEFAVEGEVARATLYASALGLYEARINGGKVGDRALVPAWTDYRRRVEYQAYDVTGLVRPGPNAIGAFLGDGWYAGRIGLASIFPVPPRGVYGAKPRFLAQLEVETRDGARVVVATDGSWKSTLEGPIRSSDLLDGEEYDGARAMPGWDRPGFDDSAWTPVAVAEDVTAELVGERCEPIRAVASWHLRKHRRQHGEGPEATFDPRENLSGRVRLESSAPLPARLEIDHAEWLFPGALYPDNLRSAMQRDVWTPAGEGQASWEPRFTIHGFRWVGVEGLPEDAEPELTALAISNDQRDAGDFACSDETLTKLWENTERTLRNNLIGLPTDCPQRDERLGWTGDIALFAETACFQRDLAAFWNKWLQDVRDAQDEDGAFPDFAPHPYGAGVFKGAPGWADAGVTIPWTAWVHYGDRRVLEASYGPARRWVERVRAANPDLVWRKARGNDYGDWLNGDSIVADGWPKQGAEVPKDVFATAHFARSAELAARTARVLGKAAEADELAALARSIRAAFVAAFVDGEGRIAGDTQAGSALALEFELLPDELRARALEHLVAAVERYPGGARGGRMLSGGMPTHHRTLLALSRGGRHDLALELARDRRFPALGYQIARGATTIWERRDGWLEGRGHADPGMNSYDHFAFGALCEWTMRAVAGIEPDEEHPGFARFRITLRDQPGLEWARGEHRSARGKIVSSWRRADGGLEVELVVPANTLATVTLPVGDPARVSRAGEPWLPAAGVRHLASAGDTSTWEVGPGRHAVRVATRR